MNFQSPEEAKLTFLMVFSMLAAALLITSEANAYIPSTQFVFTRLTANHGKGSYVIEDEVSIHEGIENIVVRENWIVVDGGEMRVAASGDGLKTFRILRRGRVSWVDESGAERSEEVSPDNFMRALFTRSPGEEKRYFINWGVLPPEAMKEKRLPKEVKDLQVETEPWVRLSRTAGTIAYTYGKPVAQDGPLLPGLWIEQDTFNIRKMRSPDGSEAQLNDYVTFAKGLVFPKNQTIVFDNHVATVRVTKVNGVELNVDQKRQLDSNWLRGHRETVTTWPKTALGPVVQEFYKRFR